ncbi:hypothetical protein [Mycoavidus cysteinexigens]|nr:hypothetical protein [Mycoavidus cysteinexigens]GAM51710.1 hypothetical protein EBME_0173 [bacterium endosymbiont of Mortierella elongata FMR23-6]
MKSINQLDEVQLFDYQIIGIDSLAFNREKPLKISGFGQPVESNQLF